MALLDAVMAKLEKRYYDEGKTGLFELLTPHLTPRAPPMTKICR